MVYSISRNRNKQDNAITHIPCFSLKFSRVVLLNSCKVYITQRLSDRIDLSDQTSGKTSEI